MIPKLRGCPCCSSRQLCVQLIEVIEPAPDEMAIECLNCGFYIKVSTQIMKAFNKKAWQDFETRDYMYRHLKPIFSAWNGLSYLRNI